MENKNKVNYEKQFENLYKNCIYRYRQANDKNIEALINERLYFSTPINFNDPFDNLIYANLLKIASNIYGNIQNGMDAYLEKLKQTDPMSAFIASEKLKGSRKEKIIDNHINTIFNIIDNIKISIRKNVKIICFSEIYNSMLMWSHYADNHKGFVLIYDKDDLKNAERFKIDSNNLKSKIKLEKAEYVDKQIDLSKEVEDYLRYNVLEGMEGRRNQGGSIAQFKLRKAIIQKSKEWDYEKEWRIIPRIIELERESELGYIECIPKGIVLGAHCTEKNSDKIIRYGKEKSVHIYRMFLDEFCSSFKLNIGEGVNAKII